MRVFGSESLGNKFDSIGLYGFYINRIRTIILTILIYSIFNLSIYLHIFNSNILELKGDNLTLFI